MSWKNRIVGHGEQAASQFLANPNNWRIHPKAQREALTGVLGEVGWVQSVIVNRTTGHVLDGHARIEEALKLGDETPVPFVEVELTEDEERKILLTLDPISAMAAADKAQLDALLHDVSSASAGVQSMLAELAEKNGLEYGATIGGELEDVEPQVDRAEELRQKWGVESGQIWQLGDHRLMCGDSTNADDAARLMNGEKADLCFTSPPYGAGNVAKLRDHHISGANKRESFYDQHKDDPDSWPSLMSKWYNTFRPISECVVCNVQMLADNKRALISWLFERIDDLCDVIIWDKVNGAPQMQKNVLTNSFEFCFVFGGNSSRTIPFADFQGSISNIFRLDHRESNKFSDMHRAVFPSELPTWFIKTLCKKAKSIVDPFCGTGTTLVVAEKLNRKCYGMEISPAYVALTLERWSQATGKTPVLLA